MEQILAILDGEEIYARRLLQFFSSRKDLIFSTAAFTSEEMLAAYMERHKITLLLCEEGLYEQLHRVPECPIMLLSDRSCVREPGGPPMVFKFQSAAEILREILMYYEKVYPERQILKSTGRTEICTICSPAGGCGVTVLAELLAQELSRQNKVLLISLDPFYFLDLSGNAKRDALSEAIYYVKQNSENEKKKQNQQLQRKGNLACLCGVTHWADISECSSEDMIALLREFSEKEYDFIVVDGGAFTDALAGSIFLSDMVFILTKDGLEFQKKYELFCQQAAFRVPEWEQKLFELPRRGKEEMLLKMMEQLGKERRESN